ncbi:flagellar motor switch protein FliG [Poseidonocella sedimentorum]|uniref:Flagellar motor switch protein FliG n=1 Tax=Poseidonocella sedimentorum TaxID=871652 RepID=A0A1I6EI77_9RHOB|nr:FliG C-terminal domain-containing protein [Poseidonocella sedimentorum]SFR17450.1 flagellar motor switch protein FliG [Poseidonocella sedimentorum]
MASALAKKSQSKAPPLSALTKKQKAAIIVRYLLAEGADLPIQALPEEMQFELTRTIGSMRYVDRKTLTAVVGEFAKELESVGIAFPDGLAGALSTMDGKISPHTASRLRREAGVRQSGDPWERLAQQDVATLRPLLEGESIEVCAVLLSKIGVRVAADLLGSIEGPRARQIAYAVSLTDRVSPDAVYRIGLSLASQLDDRPEKAFNDGPDRRVGEILNFSGLATREDVLEGLDAEDEEFANAVRKAIFTFSNISARIRAEDVPRIVRELDQDALITALAFAQKQDAEMVRSATFLLDNMSARLAGTLRDEIQDLGRVKPKDGEPACGEVVTLIRSLVDDGTIEMRDSDDEEEDEEDEGAEG